MSLSRKRRKELKRLRGSAEDVLAEQREVLEHTGALVKQAQRQLAKVAREDVAPSVRGVYDSKLKPTFASGVAATKQAASTTREHIASDVIPAVSGTIGSALAVLSAAKDPRVREIVKKASASNSKLSKKAAKKVAPPKKKRGIGKFFAIGFGVIVLAGVGYAAWQTLRADDDLWVEDIVDDTPLTSP